MKHFRVIITIVITGISFTCMAQSPTPSVSPTTPDDIDKKKLNDGDKKIMEKGSAREELSRQFRLGEPGLSGIIVDRTITMLGREFYRQFTQRSRGRTIITNKNLSIYEQPDARWGSRVWIENNNTIIFEARLSPKLSDIEGYAEAAVEQVESRIIQETIINQIENNPDLSDKEI